MTPWSQLTPQQRGSVCERVWRRLQSYGPTSATGLVHALNLPLENVGGALTDMEHPESAMVSRAENAQGVEIWTAHKRKQ